jgi:MoaD family protein
MDEKPRNPMQPGRIPITVKVFGALRDGFGATAREVGIPKTGTLHDLLAALSAICPDLVPKLEQGLRDGFLNALVNGRNVRFLDDLDTRLHADDTVAFLPPIGGG